MTGNIEQRLIDLLFSMPWSGRNLPYADLEQFDEKNFRIPLRPYHDIVQTIMGATGLSGSFPYIVIAIIIAVAALVILVWCIELVSRALKKIEGDVRGARSVGSHSEGRLRRELKKATRNSDWQTAAARSEELGEVSEAAKYYQMAGQFDKAGALYEKKGDYAGAASCFASSRQYEKAADFFIKGKDDISAAQILERSKNFMRAALVYERAGKYERAAEMLDFHFKSISATAAGDMDLLNRGAGIYEKAGKTERAAEYYLKAGSLQKAGELYEAAGNKAEAAEIFSKLRDFERAGRLFEEIGEVKKAGEMRGMMYSLKGDYSEAAAHYFEAGDFIRAAECFYAGGRFQNAAEMYLNAGYNVEAAGSYARTDQWVKAAEIYEKSGHIEAAAALYEKHDDLGKAIDSYRRSNRHYRAGHLLMKVDRFGEALEMFNSVLREDPDYQLSQAETGVCLFRMNNPVEAGDVLERALADLTPGPDNNELFYTLGLIYEKIGKRNEARKIYKRILSEDESFLDAKERLEGLIASMSEPSQSVFEKTVKLAEPSGKIEQRYEILRELGRGGMGVVSQARDMLLDRDVALKQLTASAVGAEDDARERFLREARAASRLSHPNIVSVYDVIEDQETLFIAMEYVDGKSLRQYLKEHPRPSFKLVLAIAVQVADGLQSAHDKGVIHRDIKPDNIMITRKGRVKITDFGIAHMTESTMTVSGSVMGTLKYMSPEQIKGEKVTAASDLYSFGVVLYEMVTGAPPFVGGELTYHHVHTAPTPPSEVNQKVPESLERIIMRCLDKDPAKRYASARDLFSELKTIQESL